MKHTANLRNGVLIIPARIAYPCRTMSRATRSSARSVAVLIVFAALGACAPSTPRDDEISGVVIKTRTAETAPLAIDAVYHSMEGPWQRVVLDPTDIGWITGFRTEVVDAVTGERLGDEFFCHSQIQLATSARLAVAATGIDEIRFPDGFGLPIEETINELEAPWNEISMLGMVLNNHGIEHEREVKLRFTVDYVPAGDYPVQKLYKASVPVVPNLEHQAEESAGWERGDTLVLQGEQLEPVDLPETTMGKPGHWMVPPGKQVIRQRYRSLIGIPTRVHYGIVHMHNHGASMKLTDLTDEEVLWETELQYEGDGDRVQIVDIPVYSSEEGFLLYPDHEYEVESVYDNTSSEPVDAMAVMYLYHHPLNDEHISYPIPKTPPAPPDGAHHH